MRVPENENSPLQNARADWSNVQSFSMLVLPITLYGSESWTSTKAEEKTTW